MSQLPASSILANTEQLADDPLRDETPFSRWVEWGRRFEFWAYSERELVRIAKFAGKTASSS